MFHSSVSLGKIGSHTLSFGRSVNSDQMANSQASMMATKEIPSTGEGAIVQDEPVDVHADPAWNPSMDAETYRASILAHEARVKWRTQTTDRVLALHNAQEKQQRRLETHQAKLAEHQKSHKTTHDRVGTVERSHQQVTNKVAEIENIHMDHKERMNSIEEKHSDTQKRLQQLGAQNKWIVPVLAGTALVVGFSGLWLLCSKLFGGRKKRQEREFSDGDTERDRRRSHPRSWKVAPELRSGRYGGIL
jgi:hypothetical protein